METNRSPSLFHDLLALGAPPDVLRVASREDERAARRTEVTKIMNVAQQELVRTTFARLAIMPEVAGALFYEQLFAASPDFRLLFKNDMRIQGVN